MTFRSVFWSAACFTALVLPVTAYAAPDATKAFQCAAVIQLTTASWPADHPSTAQATTLKTDWISFGKILSFPKTVDVDTEVTTQISGIEATMISMMADPAGTQTYMTRISQGCDAIPFTPISPAVCKVYARAKTESSEMNIALQEIAAFTAETRERKIEIALATRKAKEGLEKAKSATAYFAAAGERTSNESMDMMSFRTAETLDAHLETCLKQMG